MKKILLLIAVVFALFGCKDMPTSDVNKIAAYFDRDTADHDTVAQVDEDEVMLDLSAEAEAEVDEDLVEEEMEQDAESDLSTDEMDADEDVESDLEYDNDTTDADTVVAGTKTCSEINLCIGNCSEQSCVDDCLASGTIEAQIQYNDLMNCFNSNCGFECGSSGNTTDCNNCASTKCPDELDACFTTGQTDKDIIDNDIVVLDEDTVDIDVIDVDTIDIDVVDFDTVDVDTIDLDVVDVDLVPDSDAEIIPVDALCTGQTKCYNATTEMTCPAAGNAFYGQDAQYAVLGYCTPRDYAVSGSNGSDIVTDNVTGLIWQRTVNTTTYTWSNSITYCTNLTYGGQTDWRLPTSAELATLPTYGRYNPAIDTAIFPGTQSYAYWSSSPYADNTAHAWHVYFDNGNVSYNVKTEAKYARCVRGGAMSKGTFTESTIAGKVIVADTVTGLIWAKENSGVVTWQNALSYCENLNYAEYNDWRLPNINELKTLIDHTLNNPTSSFPGITSCACWSSSSYESNTTYAWYVGLANGDVNPTIKTNDMLCTRCVRGPL